MFSVSPDDSDLSNITCMSSVLFPFAQEKNRRLIIKKKYFSM